MSEQPKRKGGLSKGVDVAVIEFKRQAAANQAALTKKQRYDRKRVQIRIDVADCEIVKEALDALASEHGTSASQLGAFLLAWSLERFYTDPELDDLLGNSLAPARALRIQNDVVLDDIIKRLQEAFAKTAETSPAQT